MKFKDSYKRFIFFPVVIPFLYIFITAVPLGSDVYFLPVWIRSIAPDSAQVELSGIVGENAGSIQAEPAAFTGKQLQAFIAGNRFGYFSEDGELLRSTVIGNYVSASSYAWAAYPENTVRTQLLLPDGTPLMTVNAAGFVHIDENRIFLFEPGGNAVTRYAEDGTVLWRYAHTAPITAFHSSESGTALGFSDGRLMCLDSAGNIRFDFYPGGSSFQVILGAAVSEDGRFVVCVCGLEQQRALLIHVEKNKYKIVQHVYLKEELRKQVFVDFDKESKKAVFECAEGIGLMDCTHFTTNIIPIKGTIAASGLYPYKNIMTILTQNEQHAVLSIIENPMHLIGTTVFPSQNTFLMQKHNMIFLATDKHLARIDIKGVY